MQNTIKLSFSQKVVGSFFALMLVASAFVAILPTITDGADSDAISLTTKSKDEFHG